MNIKAKSVALPLLALAFVLALLLVMKLRAGVVMSILCYLTSVVASLIGAGFHCHSWL